MDRFDCDSSLDISTMPLWNDPNCLKVRIILQHAIQHKTYENVDMPEGALDLIRMYLFSFPPLIAAEVQKNFPSVTNKQVHNAWVQLSADFWKMDEDQIISAKMLLVKLKDQADAWEFDVPEGVQAIGWGLKGIAERLREQVVEVALDATCECSLQFLNFYWIISSQHESR